MGELRIRSIMAFLILGTLPLDGATPIPKRCPLILSKIRKVRRLHPAFIFPAFMRFLFPIQAGDPIHKRRPPCQQSSHIRAAFPICWRRSPIRFYGSSIQSPSSKKSDTDFAETSVSDPANLTPASLHEFPASPAGAVPHVQTGHQPAETSGRFTQTYASGRFAQILPSNDWGAWTPGHGVRARHRFATLRRRLRRRRQEERCPCMPA